MLLLSIHNFFPSPGRRSGLDELPLAVKGFRGFRGSIIRRSGSGRFRGHDSEFCETIWLVFKFLPSAEIVLVKMPPNISFSDGHF